MKDKKRCGNCSAKDCALAGDTGTANQSPCEKWWRNPDLWLDILPEVEGWYWWRLSEKNPHTIRYIFKLDDEMVAIDDNENVEISKLGGQFQGPIEPK